MTLEVIETETGFEVTWDPDDPVESVFNDWSAEDFMRIVLEYANSVIEDHNSKIDETQLETDFMAK